MFQVNKIWDNFREMKRFIFDKNLQFSKADSVQRMLQRIEEILCSFCSVKMLKLSAEEEFSVLKAICCFSALSKYMIHVLIQQPGSVSHD